jgi:hypothetical protein
MAHRFRYLGVVAWGGLMDTSAYVGDNQKDLRERMAADMEENGWSVADDEAAIFDTADGCLLFRFGDDDVYEAEDEADPQGG